MIKKKLKKYGQEHLLKFYDELDSKQRKFLKNQIKEIDFSYLNELNKGPEKFDGEIKPIKVLKAEEYNLNKYELTEKGLSVLASQKVGAVLLAGGMGTRLGSDKPKGMFNIGKTKDVYIFQRLIENLLEVVKLCGKMVPLFIMTSDKNHEDTVNFFEEKNYFGYDKSCVCFFKQEMAPCVDLNGKILLEEKWKVATSPNGNGGWYKSLLNNKEARKMVKKYDLMFFNIFAVDNVLQNIADPLFIGSVMANGSDAGSKVIKKVDPFEKVGVMCVKNGKPSVIEYIDLTEEMALQTDEQGERVYNHGVILNYLFYSKLMDKIVDKKLPVHVVTKKVEHINENGEKVIPQQPNAHKFELLCVDMVEMADWCLPFEVEREKEFAPIKNKTGVDSVESAQVMLEKNGYSL